MQGENTKLYVLTGFLGSGKTTVLLQLLERFKGHRVGIIQNEIGKLGIDGEILRNDDIQMVELNRGSIFCSCLKLSFVSALSEMAQKDFEYLFVESSGIGDPSNVEEILEAAKVASGKEYDFKGVICLVDAVNFMEQLEDLEAVSRQLKHCHLAVITKTDLVDEEAVQKVEEKIRQINPVCKMLASSMGEMDYGFLEEDLLLYQWAEGEDTTNSEKTKPKTLFMDFEGEVEKEKLIAFLNDVIPDVYRVKGFFRLVEEGWNQVDVVGKKIDFKPCESYEKSQLVFISKIGPAVIKKIFAAWEEKVGMEMKLRIKNQEDSMNIKVIGMGCDNCDKLYKNVQDAIAETGCDAEVEKIGDLVEIVKLGVMSAPSLMIDGKLVIAGRVAKKEEIIKLIK